MTFSTKLSSYLVSIAAQPQANQAMMFSGLLGFLGAFIMFVGDLLLYAHWQSMPMVIDAVDNLLPGRKAVLLATVSDLHISGVLGPIAAVFYLFGAWHLYIKLASRSPLWAAIAAVCFAFSIVIAGAFHALWGMFGFVVQFANQHTDQSLVLLETASNYMDFVADTVIMPLGLACAILLVRGVLGKTDHPRWVSAFNPLLLLVLGVPVLDSLVIDMAVPYGALTVGTFFNVVMMLFFAVSTVSPIRQR